MWVAEPVRSVPSFLKSCWGEECKREGRLERTAAQKGTWTGPKGEFAIEGIAAASVILFLVQEVSNHLWSDLGYEIIATNLLETSYTS